MIRKDKHKFADGSYKTQIRVTETYNQIINVANGIPRIINQLMDKSLLLLSNHKENEIIASIAMEAINEVSI